MKTHRRFRKHSMATAIAAVGLAASQGVTAQDNMRLEEVLVTARKKVENLQQTPLDITAFGSQQIRQLDITGNEDLARYTPSLTFDVGVLPNDTRPSIRGVNTNRGRPNVYPGGFCRCLQ